jgi:hypothetical protein
MRAYRRVERRGDARSRLGYKKSPPFESFRLDPSTKVISSLLGDLELHWPLGLLLHYDCPRCHALTVHGIPDPEPCQIP